MNEYIIIFVVALLFLNLPKILGYIIKGIGIKEVKFIFDDNAKEPSANSSNMLNGEPLIPTQNVIGANSRKRKVRKLK
jgi:hypothetical protein